MAGAKSKKVWGLPKKIGLICEDLL
jgi:hypothetical protein